MGFDETLAIQMSYELMSGYWKVGNRCFFNKKDCLLLASKIKDFNVTYHFFDEIYRNIDWKKELSQSLSSMYADRAKKIRDKYDYVAILFSGGADSTNVLKSFIDNDLHIDEIISFGPVKVADKLLHKFNRMDRSANNLLFEYYEAVVPMYDYLKKHRPKIKLTVIDYTNEILSLVDTNNIHKLFLSGCNANTNITGFYLTYQSVSRHDKSCVVFGIDKPRLLYNKKEGKFMSYFHDFNMIHGHFPKETFNGDQASTEYFYYDPKMPYIPAKQCQQILPDLLPIVNPSHPLHSEVMTDKGQNLIVNVHGDYVKKLIYPTWNNNIYQANKNQSHFYNEIGDWFSQTTLTTNRLKDYLDGQISELIAGIHPNFVEYDENDKPQKLIDLFTKKNFLH